jgi:hypothetical protein
MWKYYLENYLFKFKNIKYLPLLNTKILYLGILTYILKAHVNITPCPCFVQIHKLPTKHIYFLDT